MKLDELLRVAKACTHATWKECDTAIAIVQKACAATESASGECTANLAAIALATSNQVNDKLDLLATGGLIGLALALNLAYLNLQALRFPEKLRRYIDRKLQGGDAREQLQRLLKSETNTDDKAIGALIYRTATPNAALDLLHVDKSTLMDCTARNVARESPSARLFYRFAFDGDQELSPVPTWDKVFAAICGVVAVAYLFRDTAAMMDIHVANWFWFLLVGIPLAFVTIPMFASSNAAPGLIILAFVLFSCHLFLSSQAPFYVSHKNAYDFAILATCVLVPTFIVSWSNSAYPKIEKKIGDRLGDNVSRSTSQGIGGG